MAPRCQLGGRLFTNWKWDAIRGRSYHPAQKMIKEEHIVLERSARLNLDPGRGDWGDGWSFAIGQSLRIIWSFARGRSGHPRWSFARSRSLWMIIFKRLAPPEDHLQEAGPSAWSFTRGQPLQMIICKRPAPPTTTTTGWQGGGLTRGTGVTGQMEEKKEMEKEKKDRWVGRHGRLYIRGPRGPKKQCIDHFKYKKFYSNHENNR